MMPAPMERAISRLVDTEHDLIIVGGGIHGACAAWDAAQRGLRVALAEADDFCGATSWNSLKTIHGGLRYLQSLDLRRMRESIRDRRAWLRIAPALVHPLAFVAPANGSGKTGRQAFRIALALNDAIAADRNTGVDAERHLPRGRILDRDEALTLFPQLAEQRVDAAALWYDGQVSSSERLVMGLLHAAHDAGAALANYVKVTGAIRDGSRIVGVQAQDRRTQSALAIRGRVVLSATGPGTDAILQMAGIPADTTPLLRAVNLVIGRRLLGAHALGSQLAGRFLFMAPWEGHTLVGTGYRPHTETSDEALAAEFLAEAQAAFPWATLTAGDVSLVHSGLVPGERDAHGLWSRDRIRDHARDGAEGLISVLGVKFTTARAVAETAIDRVCRRLGRTAACRTACTPLPWARRLAGSVSEMTRIAVTEEMALHTADVVLRRTGFGAAGAPDATTVEAVSSTMASLLDWDDTRVAYETHATLERARLGRSASA